MVWGLPDLGWIVMVRLYCGMFFLVEVAMVIWLVGLASCKGSRAYQR